MEFRFFEPWHDFLPREGGHVVACAGAGAKNALLSACESALTEQGAPLTVVSACDVDDGDEVTERLLLVRADADARKPAALPAATGPSWPARTSLALLVMGADAVGSRAGDVVAGFATGTPLPADLGPEDLLEWDHLAALILGPGGFLDGIPDTVPVALVLTGLAEQPDSIGLFACVDRLMAHPRLPIVILGDPAAEPPTFRAACRVDEGEPGVE